MKESDFGTMILTILSILDGKVLGAGLTNREMSDKIRIFNARFRNELIKYINSGDLESKKFLENCVYHIEDILNDSFDKIKH